MVEQELRTFPSIPIDLFVIVDTHGGPSRDRIADALEEALLTLLPFYLVHDIRVVIATADPGCGGFEERFYVKPLGVGTPEEIAMWAAASVRALPSCGRSRPIETAMLLMSALRPRDFVSASTSPAFIVFTDEDDPSANADFFADEDYAYYAAFGLVFDSSASECVIPRLPIQWERSLDMATHAVIELCEDAEDWIFRIFDWISYHPDYWRQVTVPINSEGLVPCEMIEVRRPQGYHPRCSDLPGRDTTPLDVDEHGFETCLVRQIKYDEDGPGWRVESSHVHHLDRTPTLVNAPSAFDSDLILRCCAR